MSIIKRIALVLAACAALCMIVSCENPEGAETPVADSTPAAPLSYVEAHTPEAAYDDLTDGFQTYYLDVAACEFENTLQGFHFKNFTDHEIGLVIDEIFANSEKSETGKTVIWDFEDPESGSNYWGFGAGTIADGVWNSGAIAAAPVPGTTETYITGFASGAFYDVLSANSDVCYVGIRIKNLSATQKGDEVTIVPILNSLDAYPDQQFQFKDFFRK